MIFLKPLTKRFLTFVLVLLTLVQTFMLGEVAYALENDPARFVLRLSEELDQEIDQRQANLVFRVLHLFPETFYGSLNKITLYFKKHEHGPRGRANSREIQLRTARMSDPEMLAVFIHELGHVYDLGTAKGSRAGDPTTFKFKNGDRVRSDDPSYQYYQIAWDSTERLRRGIRPEIDFASQYGTSSPFEDFGEAFVFYVLHGPEFLRRTSISGIMRQKYQYLLETVFGDQTFDLATLEEYPETFFDVTKLDYNFPRLLAQADQRRQTLALGEEERKRKRTRRPSRLGENPLIRLRNLFLRG